MMQRIGLLVLVCMPLFFGVYPSAAEAADQEHRVAIVDFRTEEAGRYENLGDALKLMLSGRLASREGVTVVGSSLSAEEKRAVRSDETAETGAIFATLDVDYIGTGGMTAEGGGLRLEMTFLARDGRAPISVSTMAGDEGEILAAVDTLAEEIARKVFGLGTEEKRSATVANVDRSGVDAFRTEHPDRKFKREIITGAAVSGDGAGVEILQGDMLRRRASLDGGVVSLSVTDLDADGIEELAAVSARDLRVYRYDRGLLEKIGEISFANTIEVHAMTIADTDGDGIKEIYVSAVDDDRFSSRILEWTQARGFKVLAEGIRWAIRPVAIPGEGYRLIGQNRSVKVVRFLEPGLHYIDVDYASGKVVRGERLSVPKGVNLFDFTFADIDGDGLSETVTLTRNMKLVVHDHQNRLLWASNEGYGGRNLYLGDRWLETDSVIYGQEVSKSGEALFELQYIPVGLVAEDMDGDGSDEILTARNSLSLFKELTNLRSFSDGQVVCLGWNGAAMQELWSTDTLDGHVAAFALEFPAAPGTAPAGDGQDREAASVNTVSLYVGQAPASSLGGILNIFADTTNLVIYNFGIAWETANQPATTP